MWGSIPEAASLNSVLFVSGLSISSGEHLSQESWINTNSLRPKGTIASYKLRKKPVAVRNCRNIGKKDMKLNDITPNITVDPESYKVPSIVVWMTWLSHC